MQPSAAPIAPAKAAAPPPPGTAAEEARSIVNSFSVFSENVSMRFFSLYIRWSFKKGIFDSTHQPPRLRANSTAVSTGISIIGVNTKTSNPIYRKILTKTWWRR
jgi:hypothetical protein